MAWIKITAPEEAQGELALSYRRLGAPPARLDQVLLVHSQRPHTLDAHMALYRAVLHHPANTLDTALAEAIGVRVSLLNQCSYCVAHHSRGLERALGDPDLARFWLDVLNNCNLAEAFDGKQIAALEYAELLTRSPGALGAADVRMLRQAGWSDGEILEINQVAAYFSYANRTVLGLGASLDEEA